MRGRGHHLVSALEELELLSSLCLASRCPAEDRLPTEEKPWADSKYSWLELQVSLRQKNVARVINQYTFADKLMNRFRKNFPDKIHRSDK
jgi:hypothetical protein